MPGLQINQRGFNIESNWLINIEDFDIILLELTSRDAAVAARAPGYIAPKDTSPDASYHNQPFHNNSLPRTTR